MQYRNARAVAAAALLVAASVGSYAANDIFRGKASSTCVGRASGWQGRVSGQQPAATHPRVELRIVQLVNAYRVELGLPRLTPDPRLAFAARAHSLDERQRSYFAHERPGDGFVQRFARYSPSVCIAENLAWGTGTLGTAASIFAAWKRSPSHDHVMRLTWIHRVGVGVSVGRFKGQAGARVVTADFSS